MENLWNSAENSNPGISWGDGVSVKTVYVPPYLSLEDKDDAEVSIL